ncbi:MAG TPA: PKD domain-containing protein [Ferruginibacter sp.]|nr:PKD domain-containing protein [Ferruginibacter sp.]
MQVSLYHTKRVIQFALTGILLLSCALVSAQATPDFTASRVSGCAPVLVQYTSQPASASAKWRWDLGNGTISYLQNPSVTYLLPGKYTVKLVVELNGREDSIVKNDYIIIHDAPVADFTATATTGCTPLLASFSDESKVLNSEISTWEWDLGDGRLSTDKNPSCSYTNAGNYNVTLKVSSSQGCTASIQKQAFIKANGVKAAFTATDISTCTEAKANFTNLSTGNGKLSYQWHFGDTATSLAKQQAYRYADGGTYAVRLKVTNDFGCSDSVSNTVKLPLLVSADFVADKTNFCTAPATVNFSNKHIDGNVYLWSFGNKSTGESANPKHTYTDTGRYTVKLIVANMNGCMDSVIKVDYIKAVKQKVWFTNLPDSGCLSFFKKFETNVVSHEKIMSWSWNFGNGKTSLLPEPSQTFTNTGYYDISLVTQNESGCRDTLFMPKGIRVDTKPKADFIADKLTVCGNNRVTFTDKSTGGVTGWEWTFGDGSKEFIKTPRHIFTDTGWMNVGLAAYKGGCADTLTRNKVVLVQPAIACFRVAPDCANPHTVKFFNCSKGADTYLWQFGDGASSTEALPIHTYKDTGRYEVQLIATNQQTGCVYIQTREVIVTRSIAGFYATDTVVCAGKSVTFRAETKGAADRLIWDFGDESRASTAETSIEHIYTKQGNYTVRLITADLINCRDTLDRPSYIRVMGPVAAFETNKPVVGVNTALVFNDKSQAYNNNAIIQWRWYPGDGTTAESNTPAYSHTYRRQALYYPSLKITDIKGCSDSVRLNVPVAVTKVQLRFDVAKNVVCPGSKVKFYAQPFNPALKYNWYFGDGKTATGLNPEHLYETEGVFDVKLLITDQQGNVDSLLRPGFIKVRMPVADFAISAGTAACPPVNISFTNYSKNAVSAVWDFGDGSATANNNPWHFYTRPGTYPAKLTVTGEGGCSSELLKEIVVKGPDGVLEYDTAMSCKPALAVLKAHTTNTVQYTWDFGDGHTTRVNDTLVQHVYAKAGSYMPKLLLMDENGCQLAITGKKPILVAGVKAAFTVKSSSACDSSKAWFTNTSVIENDVLQQLQWHFGDGNSAATAAPVHQYEADGTYTPALVVHTAGGCSDTVQATQPVSIRLSPVADIDATAVGCAPLSVEALPTLKRKQNHKNLSWHWDFGDGKMFEAERPPVHLYNQPGQYKLQLIITAANGCKTANSLWVKAEESPVVKVTGDTVICSNNRAVLKAAGADSFSWYSLSGSLLGQSAMLHTAPDTTAAYIVKGTNSNGCSASDTIQVQVVQKQQLKYTATAVVCTGQSTVLAASGTDTYEWYPATGLSSTAAPAPVAQPGSSTVYRIIGGDRRGCFKDTGFIQLSVYPVPFVSAGKDITITAGTATELVPVMSDDVTQVQWSPTSAIFRNSGNGITVRPAETTEYLVQVKNAGGCQAADKVKVLVNCSGNDVFIPNTFSPNGDGNNDIFYVRGKGGFTVKSIQVFSRNGQPVFVRTNFNPNNPSAGWDGTFKGAALASDVFVYRAEVLCAGGEILVFNGNIALVR